jgi:hypothetical protein
MPASLLEVERQDSSRLPKGYSKRVFLTVGKERKEVRDGLVDRVYIAENGMPREAFVRVPDQL